MSWVGGIASQYKRLLSTLYLFEIIGKWVSFDIPCILVVIDDVLLTICLFLEYPQSNLELNSTLLLCKHTQRVSYCVLEYFHYTRRTESLRDLRKTVGERMVTGEIKGCGEREKLSLELWLCNVRVYHEGNMRIQVDLLSITEVCCHLGITKPTRGSTSQNKLKTNVRDKRSRRTQINLLKVINHSTKILCTSYSKIAEDFFVSTNKNKTNKQKLR